MSNHFYDKINKRETFEFKITYTLLGTLNETKKIFFFCGKLLERTFILNVCTRRALAV